MEDSLPTHNRHAVEPALNIRGLRPGLREEFKSVCALMGITMTQAIAILMEKVVQERKIEPPEFTAH